MFTVSRSRLVGRTENIGKSGENPALSRNCESMYNAECIIYNEQLYILNSKLYIDKARRPAVSFVCRQAGKFNQPSRE
jgi:hypothetical protein